MRECTHCRLSKSIEDFHKHPRGRFGRSPKCKPCAIEAASAYYRKNKEKVSARRVSYYEKTADESREYSRLWYRNNRDRALAAAKAWAEKNQEITRQAKAAWNSRNPDKKAASC